MNRSGAVVRPGPPPGAGPNYYTLQQIPGVRSDGRLPLIPEPEPNAPAVDPEEAEVPGDFTATPEAENSQEVLQMTRTERVIVTDTGEEIPLQSEESVEFADTGDTSSEHSDPWPEYSSEPEPGQEPEQEPEQEPDAESGPPAESEPESSSSDSDNDTPEVSEEVLSNDF